MTPFSTPTKKSRPEAAAAVVTPSRSRLHRTLIKPQVKEASTNGRARCKRCQKVIPQGEQRWGKNYGQGHHWWHEACWNQYRDKIGRAKTGRATCQVCNEKIDKGSPRVSLETYGPPRFDYGYVYYHHTCLTSQEIGELQLQQDDAAASLDATTRPQQQPPPPKDPKEPLRQKLKHLRQVLAARLSSPNFKIYSNQVIEELLQNMPQTEDELVTIRGMGPSKVQNFGQPILKVVKQYRWWPGPKRRKKSDFFKPPNKVQVITTPTCEQIVQQHFEDAERNGYVIRIDG